MNQSDLGDSRGSPKSISDNDSEDDSTRIFSAVLAQLKLDNLSALCSSVRKSLAEPTQHSLTTSSDPDSLGIEAPIFGSYHVLYPIKFDEGPRWLLKLPAHGVRGHFNESAAAALTSEALTMKLLARETSVPIPTVFAFDDSLDNELGCPFILMSFIPGISLYDSWFDKNITSKDELYARRRQSMKDIAHSMAQLDRFSFNRGGSPMFDARGNITDIGPLRRVDGMAMLERGPASENEGDGDDSTIYYEAGPFSDPSSFLSLPLERQGELEDPTFRGLQKLLSLFLSWIPESYQYEKNFVLTHPDFDIQNVIVSEDGRLQGLIDWDGIAAVPRTVGNESYPSWLTRDWDPAMYGWNEDMEQGIEPVGVWEDSPTTLAMHRAEYERFIQSALAEDRQRRGVSEPSAVRETPDLTPATTTAQSLFIENLYIAASDSICITEILRKFVEEIVQLLQKEPTMVSSSGDPDEKPEPQEALEGLDLFSVIAELADGELNAGWLMLLRRGFDALVVRGQP